MARQGAIGRAVLLAVAIAAMVVVGAARQAAGAAGPYLQCQVTNLGGGLIGYDFSIVTSDTLQTSYTVALAFQGVAGATIKQTKALGTVAVHSESAATTFDGSGTPPYVKARDTWVCSPFGDNPIMGANPLTGQPLTGMAEGADTYALSCYSGAGSQLGSGVNVAHVVADGNIVWTGTIGRASVNHAVSGQTDAPEAIAGDFSGDGMVDIADYTTWADHFGGSDSSLALGSSNEDGAVDIADYTTWADNFGHAARGILAPGAVVTQLAGSFVYVEGPILHSSGSVYFSDIPASKTYKWTAGSGVSLVRSNTNRGNGLGFDLAGNLLCCETSTGRVVSINSAGAVTVIAAGYNGKRFNETNDLWVDYKGGVYITDPGSGSTPQDGNHVYYLTPDRTQVIRVTTDLVKPNGITGTPDGHTLYVGDYGGGKTFRYTINPDGTLRDKTLFALLNSDGMTIDAAGNVYMTTDAIYVYSPSGKQIARIAVPQTPNNMCFMGPNRSTLFITANTAIYSVETTATGVAEPASPPPGAQPAAGNVSLRQVRKIAAERQAAR